MVVRLNGDDNDLVTSEGGWDNDCVERVHGKDVVISYSGGSVKESGEFGSGAWHIKGGTMKYPHKECLGRRALSSRGVELIHTLRCLASIRIEGWTGVIHRRLGNLGVVKNTVA